MGVTESIRNPIYASLSDYLLTKFLFQIWPTADSHLVPWWVALRNRTYRSAMAPLGRTKQWHVTRSIVLSPLHDLSAEVMCLLKPLLLVRSLGFKTFRDVEISGMTSKLLSRGVRPSNIKTQRCRSGHRYSHPFPTTCLRTPMCSGILKL